MSAGTYPARAVTGQTLTVAATVFREGHDAVAANVVVKRPGGGRSPFLRMRPGADDRWTAPLTIDAEGLWSFTIEAWGDPLGTWWHDAPSSSMPTSMSRWCSRTGHGSTSEPSTACQRHSEVPWSRSPSALRDVSKQPRQRLDAALEPEAVRVLSSFPIREFVTSAPPRTVWVDRPRALFGSWCEFFPRSEGASIDPPRSGTFRTAIGRLPASRRWASTSSTCRRSTRSGG